MVVERKAYKLAIPYLVFIFAALFYTEANAAVTAPATQADCFASRQIEKACLEAEAKKEITLVSREKKIVTKRLGGLGGMTLATYRQDDQIKVDYEKICGAVRDDVINGRYELFPKPEIKSSDVGPYEFAKAMRQEYIKYSAELTMSVIDAIDSFIKIGPSPTTDYLSAPMWMYIHNSGMAFAYFLPKKGRVYIENNFHYPYGGRNTVSSQIMNEWKGVDDNGYEFIKKAAVAVAKINGGLYGIQTGQYAIDFDADERDSHPDYVSIKYYELRDLNDKSLPHWKVIGSESGKVTKIFVSGEENRYAAKQIVAIFPFDPPWKAAYDKAAREGVRLVAPENFYGRPCLWYLP